VLSSVAYAIVHEDPPEVYIAESIEVLSEVLARQVIARSSSADFEAHALARIREALLQQNWSDAVEAWIIQTGVGISVFDSEVVWSQEMLGKEPYRFIIRGTPIFKNPHA
jgi:hypothetical protein